MRILWLAKKDLDYSMSRTTFTEIIPILKKLGHEVRFITGYRKEQVNFGLGDSIRYISSVQIKGLNTLSFSVKCNFAVIQEMFTFKPDVILLDLYTTLSAFPVDLFSKLGLVKTKVVMDVRSYIHMNDDESDRANLIRKKMFDFSIAYSKRMFQGITVITPHMERQMKTWYSFPDDWLGMFSSGVNLNLFNPEKTYPPKWEFANGRFIIMFHGAITAFRNLDDSIRAVAMLVPEMPDLLYVIMGRGEHQVHLEALVQALGIEKNVYFEPAKSPDEVPAYVKACDVGIIPYPPVDYWQTSSPIKLFEYLAMGKPVVVSELFAFRDVMGGDFEGCAYAAEGGPEGFANAIRSIRARIDDNPGLGNGGKKIAARYSWREQAKALVWYFEQVQTR